MFDSYRPLNFCIILVALNRSNVFDLLPRRARAPCAHVLGMLGPLLMNRKRRHQENKKGMKRRTKLQRHR